MSIVAIIATVLASLVFLGVIVVAVLKQIASRQDRAEVNVSHPKSEREFDLSRASSEQKKKGFDFASKRQARRKSFPGPWNRRR